MNPRVLYLIITLTSVGRVTCQEYDEALNVTFRLTEHFRTWLDDHGYADDDFTRDDVVDGSYGGRTGEDDTVVNQPVIFVHGVTGKPVTWKPVIEYFTSQGYKSSEMYITTWGFPDPKLLPKMYFAEEHITRLRRFFEAVIEYTETDFIDVISGSFGVPLSRKVIKGGAAWDNGTYDVGPPLTSKVDTWIGIVGVNLGMNTCANKMKDVPICNAKNGMYPGVMVGRNVLNRSEFLEDLLQDPGFEGRYRYVLFSTKDELLRDGEIVYCEYSGRVPNQTDEKIFTTEKYNHEGTENLTGELQLSLIKNHTML